MKKPVLSFDKGNRFKTILRMTSNIEGFFHNDLKSTQTASSKNLVIPEALLTSIFSKTLKITKSEKNSTLTPLNNFDYPYFACLNTL
jgi:hypothetical protein